MPWLLQVHEEAAGQCVGRGPERWRQLASGLRVCGARQPGFLLVQGGHLGDQRRHVQGLCQPQMFCWKHGSTWSDNWKSLTKTEVVVAAVCETLRRGFIFTPPPGWVKLKGFISCGGQKIGNFEIWICRIMETIIWLDKVTNEEILRRVNEDRQILNYIWQRKHRWIGHVLQNDRTCRNLLKAQ